MPDIQERAVTGGGDRGLQAFCDRFKDTFNGWWGDLGTPQLDAAAIAKLVAVMAK
ncbi:hypothetical protein PEL8287_00638 [Roseovarius litorisediminis]|uniref:Uncharacterized protein n=1 Tax=Roseovarius litorisediminis TaxID=1312363 RepID=A0A1Y5RF93_9RHOB|nr:hypothetical protein [Roseovarius litorisediminis]SLN15224.1 hypothetical protein PEL8287_00638 [Roseovarius litorisediminis]